MPLDKKGRRQDDFDMARVIASAFLFVHLLALAGSVLAEETPGAAAYGLKVKFSAGHSLHFPDFDLTYVGKRRVTPPQYPRGWWSYDFKVRGKNDEQTVSWSAGTGDIGPTRFKVNGADFQIELSRSDKLGPLRDDEMVVSVVK
jgi:hypothetical protein